MLLVNLSKFLESVYEPRSQYLPRSTVMCFEDFVVLRVLSSTQEYSCIRANLCTSITRLSSWSRIIFEKSKVMGCKTPLGVGEKGTHEVWLKLNLLVRK